ncbi:phosphoribosylamine--glycine ligase [Sulfuriroseicoccus oceanibius]|uniref:Phosphoribosylamine--glycine ligase n=1 Tax=Sulfuriroseicoccus oceanibius TaxID=2707525 RepID=A0A6B3L9U2_9BACT|nr:phosphoribosylamine--glycine ligase [Sulfuriroseicoccus oceanibius]QQL43921.1 phosphoribosylamine--glycine ligase [Sulfuriroseicoccus oceanibius]
MSKVLVVGKGGREHALIRACVESTSETEVFAWPGSDAIFDLAKPTPVTDFDSLVEWIGGGNVDLVVAGEEAWLVYGEGLANACERLGVPCWGPKKEAAQLEASKEFAKEFMVRHNIPTGGYVTVDNIADARAAIGDSYPCVLKFDGLAAGKGVAVCPDSVAAEEFLDEVFTTRRFGEGRLVVEEFLTGPEVSIFVSVVDGEYQILTPARDYKRLADGDLGPNTGGMGAVAGRSLLDAETLAIIEETAVKRTVEGLQKDGLQYRGFLYFGFMLTPEGPKLLEYNCRFGDPECQAVMPLVSGDFTSYVMSGAKGKLDTSLIDFSSDWSVCLVAASAGYPASSRNGDVIRGLDEVTGARVYHAGTKKNEAGEFATNGGRVLAVVAQGATRQDAVAAAYEQFNKVDFDGSQRRTDIGTANFD